MPTRIPTKLAIVLLLVGAALLGRSTDRFVLGLLAFGILNALWSPPGTAWVRGLAIAGCAIGLIFPSGAFTIFITFLFWLLWLPAFLVGWSLTRKPPIGERDPGHGTGQFARRSVAVIIAAVGIGVIAYKAIFANQLQQTAALFVGIPALLAIVVVLFTSPRSAKGVACKAVTIGLLVALVFLGEGMLCILMSAPIFYAIALGVGAAADAVRRPDDARQTLYSSLLLLILAPLSLEGVTDSLSFNRNETVTATKIVHASAESVGRAVLAPPRFERAMPLPLRMGFPRPSSVRIDDGASRWIIRMRGGEMRLDGMEPRAGDLILELEAVRPGVVRWRAISDDSHMTHFLSWQSVAVDWTSIDAQTTRVTWTLQFRRGLDPSWYFGPWERHVARMAAAYLIDAVATP